MSAPRSLPPHLPSHLLLDGAAAVGVLGVLVEVAHGGVPGRGGGAGCSGARPGRGAGVWCRGAGARERCGAVRGGAALPDHIRRPGTAPLLRAGPGGAGPGGAGLSRAQRASAAGPTRPSPSRRSRCRHRSPSSGAGTRPPAPPGAAPGRRRLQSRPSPAPRDRGEVFFLLLGSSYFNYFPPLFSTKNFSTLMNFRVSTFLKGPPGSDLGRGRAVPSVHPRGGETRLSPAGVREPRDCTFVTSDESPEPQEQQPSELRTGICNPGTAALSLRRAAPNPPRQYPRSLEDNSLVPPARSAPQPSSRTSLCAPCKALFLCLGGGAALRHRIMESVRGVGP